MRSIIVVFLVSMALHSLNAQLNQWGWVQGHSPFGVNDNVVLPEEYPAGRSNAATWTGIDGNFWLFGGMNERGEFLNDFWKFDINTKRWSLITENVAAIDKPGKREGATTWADSAGNLWLFGGYFFGNEGVGGYNDLWKFNGESWTLISGDNSPSHGTHSDSIKTYPGPRSGAMGWTDDQDNLWLFGGNMYFDHYHYLDIRGEFYNDLWKFDGEKWIMVQGNFKINDRGDFGVMDVASSTNLPPARANGIIWKDSVNYTWLFGGEGGTEYFNDLWKYDGNNWTWVKGGGMYSDDLASYGTKSVPAKENVPGGRTGALGWKDNEGNFLIFGGYGNNHTDWLGAHLNDMWKFDGTFWTWVGGDSTYCSQGVYGSLGKMAPDNFPAARSHPAGWTDKWGNFWMFGGRLWNCNNNEKVIFKELWTHSTSFVMDVDQNEEENILVYPNPTNDYVLLRWKEPNNRTLFLYNITGQCVFHQEVQYKEVRLDLSPVASGFYKLVVGEKKKIMAITLIKN